MSDLWSVSDTLRLGISIKAQQRTADMLLLGLEIGRRKIEAAGKSQRKPIYLEPKI